MIVGEAEIQGQVKRAYEVALAAGTTGPLTNRLFTAALQTGKRVRSETSIGHRARVDLVGRRRARPRRLGDRPDPRVVIIGAGETSELTARAFAEHGVCTIFVANRHADRARSLADRFGGEVVALDDLPAQLERADVVVASTASPHPIVGQEELELVMRARQGRPLLLVDIAVPRDIDPACADLDGVTLFDMDDLQARVAHTISVREAEALRAESIVEEEIKRFADVARARSPCSRRSARCASTATRSSSRCWPRTRRAGSARRERDVARAEAIARSVMNRLLHEPTLRLRTMAEGRSHGRLQIMRELFGLEGAPEARRAGRRRATQGERGNVRPLPRRASS